MAPISVQFNATLLKGQRFQAHPIEQQYRHPILVEEIDFTFSAGPAGIADVNTARAIFHQLNFGLKFGAAVAMLDKTAPLASFCRRAGVFDGYASNLNAGPIYYQTAPNGFYNGLTARSWAKWTLPDGVFVPEKAQIEALIEYAADIPNATDASIPPSIQVWVTLTGQALPKMEPWPKVVRIPWVTHYKTAPVAISAGSVESATPENALQNQNEQPVVVQRMLGSIASQRASDEVVDVLVRVSDTTGAYIVREKTPLLELFNGRTRCWDMGAVLKPKEFVVVEYEYDVADIVGQTTPLLTYQATDEFQLIFGLVGYREMSIAEVYPEVLVPATGQPPIQPGDLPVPSRANGLLPSAKLGAYRPPRRR